MSFGDVSIDASFSYLVSKARKHLHIHIVYNALSTSAFVLFCILAHDQVE